MSNIYDVKIYEKTWGLGSGSTLVAVLDEVSSIRIERQISNLSRTTFDIPRGNTKLSDISIGKQVKIFRKDNGNLEYEGVISGPLDKNKNPIVITTFSKGLHLEGYKVPWSFEFENVQFDDLLNNELLYEYRFIRINTLDDFDDGAFTNTGTINVASGVTPSEEDVWITLAQTAYETVSGTLQVVGQSSPATLDSPRELAIQGTKIYVANYVLDALTILSISSPATPRLVSTLANSTYLDGAAHIDVSGNTCVVTGYRTFAVLDISNPAVPTIVAAQTGVDLRYGAIRYLDGYAYTYAAPYDFDVIDVTLPSLPIVGNIYDDDKFWSLDDICLSSTGSVAYTVSHHLPDGEFYFTTIGISSPTAPTIIGYMSRATLKDPVGLATKGNYAFIAARDTNSFVSVNVGSPATLKITNYISNTQLRGIKDIDIGGNTAWCISEPPSVGETVRAIAIDISDPANPTMIGAAQPTSYDDFMDVKTINQKMYVTDRVADDIVVLTTGTISIAGATRFVSSGTYISDSFDLKSDAIDQVTLIDLNRIRYQAIVGQTGDITVRVRYAPDSGGSPGSWSAWSAGQSQVIEDEMKHLGITTFAAMATTDQWVQVAFELSSNTSYSNSSSYSPAIQAFEIVGQHPMQDFAIGSIASTTEGERITASFDSHLQILDHVVEIWGMQWEITNSGTIHTLTTVGNNLSDTIRLEEEKNCNVINYSEEDEELINVVWGLGHGEGLNRLFSKQTNYTRARTYGKRVSVWETANRDKTTLQNEAVAYRNEHQYPISRISLDVIEPPDYFRAGDIIHFISDPMDVDNNYQIRREVRFEDDTGERIQIDLDEIQEKYTDEYINDQEEIKAGVDDSIKNYASGVAWTGWISADDTTWKEININVGWEGEFGKAQVIQIHEETTDSYTVAGTSAIAEIARYTTEGMVIRYRRLNTGANRIRLEISWEVWSTKMRRWRTAS